MTSIISLRAKRKPVQGLPIQITMISIEWLATREKIRAAERRQKNRKSPSRILIVNGSSRSDQTCPGEMSKTYRLAMIAKKIDREVARFRG